MSKNVSAQGVNNNSFVNPLIKKCKLNSPVVECSPVIWKDRLYLTEAWQSHFWDDDPGSPETDFIRIRDVEKNEIVTKCMVGYGYPSAFVWKDIFYIFVNKWQYVKQENVYHEHNIYMSKSIDLLHWTEPRMIIEQKGKEMRMTNPSVCYDGKRFVMVYESDDRTYPNLQSNRFPAILKFAESTDLENWTKIKGVVYGGDFYAGCPPIRYVGGCYYMLYLAEVSQKEGGRRGYQTNLIRSKDLIEWEESQYNPVIAIDWNDDCYPLYYERRDTSGKTKANNASDADLVEWKDKTLVYFTGGCQLFCGDLQYAEFDGTIQEFFESYYVEPIK